MSRPLVGIKDVNRPGLQLAGYFDYFDERRLQVIGMAETKMLESMTSEQRSESFAKLFSYNIPALVVSRDLDIYPECLTMARKYQRTLLHTAETTVDFTTKVIELLTQLMAPTITRHGVLLDIYGEGGPHHRGQRHRQERDRHRAGQAGPPAGG